MMRRIRSIKITTMVLNLIFVFTILFLMIISYFSFLHLQDLVKANISVSHTYDIIRKIDESLYNFTEIESEQRAYLITGNQNFLENIDSLKTELAKNLKAMEVLVIANKKQEQRLQRYVAVIKERFQYLDKSTTLRKRARTLSEGLNAFAEGSELSTEAKGLGQEIKSVEETLLTERNARAIEKSSSDGIFLVIASLCSLVFLIIPFILANFELINRRIIEHKNRNIRTHLRQIIESTDDMIAALDTQNRFEIFNQAYHREFLNLFGQSIKIGMSMTEALAHVIKAKHPLLDIWKKSLQPHEVPHIMEFTREETKFYYELRSIEIKSDVNEIKGLIHNIRDISPRVREHSKLQDSYKKLSIGMQDLEIKNAQINLLVDMSDIMLAANSQEELSKVMARYAHSLFPLSSGYLFIMHPSRNYLERATIWGNPHTQEKIIMSDQCWAIRLGRLHQVKELTKDLLCEHIKISKTMPTLLCIPLMAQNDIYGLIYIEMDNSTILNEENRLIISAFSELTALALANIRLRENLRYQSIRDALTGLYNRRYLEDALFKQIYQAGQSNSSFGLLMLDIDNFKKINDNYGHELGDLALKEVGKILEDFLRSGDVAARYGGEEFILMLCNIDLEKTKKRAEEIRLAITKLQIRYGAQPVIPISCSIGIAIFPVDSKSKDELIEFADKALYLAKNQGRNQVVTYASIS